MNLRAILFIFSKVTSKWTLLRHPVWLWSRQYCRYLVFANFCAALLATTAFTASASTADICDKAARHAAAEFGVPFPILWSITRTETGRSRDGQLTPWPWTVNMEGKGHWFKTKHDARAYVGREFERGARSFDVGCFQINYKWHGASFRNIDQMFDPIENARYAAAFLTRLYRESGDWSIAAGAYHSRTPEFSKRYRARFEQIHADYRSNDDISPNESSNPAKRYASNTSPERKNTYPLLIHADTPARNGSLVPLINTQSRALFAIPGVAEKS